MEAAGTIFQLLVHFLKQLKIEAVGRQNAGRAGLGSF
jgi:hypothetical protein